MIRSYWDKQKEIRQGSLAVVTDIQRFTVHDGPGIRTMVFFKGCPLRCQWCQNPETWNQCPELMYYRDSCIHCGGCMQACQTGALSLTEAGVSIDPAKCTHCGQCAEACFPGALKVAGRLLSVEEVLDQVLRDEIFYKKSGGGVTLSGGECTVYADFIETLLAQIQQYGIHTAIETCGFCDWSRFQRILAHVDLVLFDIKVPKKDLSRHYTGQDCGPILENLKRTRALGKRVILRYPMIPHVNDDRQTLDRIAAVAAENGIVEIHILPFHQMGSGKWHALSRSYLCEEKDSPTEEQVDRVRSFLLAQGLHASVGGADTWN